LLKLVFLRQISEYLLIMLVTTFVDTNFGIFKMTGSELGIREVVLTNHKEKSDSKLPKVVQEGKRQLEEYFEGKRTQFDVKLDWSGAPDFHIKVWKELLQIPFGRTTSYLAIAEKLGDKKAVRAVGQANKHNPIAIIVPCHRVVAKNGDLHGYFYGVDMKRQLLEWENPIQFGAQGSLF
jgi:methylated-DNA-[protein]-cysteine S-methyltransferase